MDVSPRRKKGVALLILSIVAVLIFMGYAFLWKSRPGGLPNTPPPLPDVPANPPSDEGTPPPPPSLPL